MWGTTFSWNWLQPCLLESQVLPSPHFKYGGEWTEASVMWIWNMVKVLLVPSSSLNTIISFFSFSCLFQWFLQCGSHCHVPGLWLAPPVTPYWVSLPVTGFLAIGLVLRSLGNHREIQCPSVSDAQRLPAVFLSAKCIASDFLKHLAVTEHEVVPEKWWPQRALNSLRCGFGRGIGMALVEESVGFQVGQTWVLMPSLPLWSFAGVT